MARAGRWVGGACVVLLLLAGASSAAGVVVPKQGTFAGTTSQDFTGSVVGLQVSGSQIRNESIVWHARCTSGKTLGSITHVPTQRISNGRWSAQGACDTMISNGLSARAVLGGRDGSPARSAPAACGASR